MNIQWENIVPDENNDWINKKNVQFDKYIPIEPEKKYDDSCKSYFTTYSLGASTSKDSWLYNFSKNSLKQNVNNMVEFYNHERNKYHSTSNQKEPKDVVTYDEKKIVWTDLFLRDLKNNKPYLVDTNKIENALYRPFTKTNLMFEKDFIQRTYKIFFKH